jgi:hypothetical protein
VPEPERTRLGLTVESVQATVQGRDEPLALHRADLAAGRADSSTESGPDHQPEAPIQGG